MGTYKNPGDTSKCHQSSFSRNACLRNSWYHRGMMSVRWCVLVLFCLLAQHAVTPLVAPWYRQAAQCKGVKLHFVGFEVPNARHVYSSPRKMTFCNCAHLCQSKGSAWVHVMYIPDEKQCYCWAGTAKRGEKRSDTWYYKIE